MSNPSIYCPRRPHRCPPSTARRTKTFRSPASFRSWRARTRRTRTARIRNVSATWTTHTFTSLPVYFVLVLFGVLWFLCLLFSLVIHILFVSFFVSPNPRFVSVSVSVSVVAMNGITHENNHDGDPPRKYLGIPKSISRTSAPNFHCFSILTVFFFVCVDL